MREQWLNDNRRVKQGKNYADFLQVSIRTQCGDEYPSDYEIHLTRYTCPGRYDTYSFALQPNGNIVYWSETNTTLPQAIKLLMVDLGRSQIVDMIDRMLGKVGNRRLAEFLFELAPRSQASRLMQKRIRAANKTRQLPQNKT